VTDELAHSILVVDDDATFRTRLVRAFAERRYDARGAAGAAEAVALAREDSPELAVVDLRMPDGNGLDVVRDLLAIDPSTRIVVLTGYGSIATAVDAMRLGAVHYLSKPADADQILAAIDPNRRVEWEHIQRVLSDCGGNVSQAARLLGLHRRSLQRKLAKYPVRR